MCQEQLRGHGVSLLELRNFKLFMAFYNILIVFGFNIFFFKEAVFGLKRQLMFVCIFRSVCLSPNVISEFEFSISVLFKAQPAQKPRIS
jgi:hypothetical protein